ncbi:two-component system, response regulator YesN [Paenibacillus sp. UNCCL117]|uniref:response regulator n=1 Tax=unclassified Paenibacillus TaxID=185978 RepID=UPI000881E8E9|nr:MULTISPECIES: response regulator [unclassified Paenibacillus]SDD58378.1 two-component system, response regulator YesN [Paenibacillus sp. cl123]SFW51031.1 two-component system, response regulator YesN [Paenibacillus sp. UNCCL117]
MYKVLIVDDEPEIRQGLKLKADWEALGLTIAGEADHGLEALEWLANHPVELVVTDMNMPVMDGVTFLEACHEHHPSLRLLVITGYEDFSYAKAAIRHQARDYLLKPVSRDELTEALAKVVRELDEERREVDQQAVLQWRLSEYYKEMREHFLIHLVKEKPERGSMVWDRVRQFQLDGWEKLPVRFLTAGFAERSEASGEQVRTPDKLRLPFELVCREVAAGFAERVQVFRDAGYPGLMQFIVQGPEAESARLSESLIAAVTKHLGFCPVVGTGQEVTGLEQWKDGYLSALLDWNLRSNKDRYAGSVQFRSEVALSEDTVRMLQRCLSRGELETFEQTVSKELSAAFAASQARFVKLIFQLYLLLDAMAYTAGVTLDSGEQLWIRPEQVWGFDTVDKARQFLVRLARKTVRSTADEMADADYSMIQAAMQFIQDNYMADINLTLLAERFNYNSSYFSEMFKARAGKTFIQYLTDVRMAKAVQLLEETMLGLWDIAELTGFSNASYFSSKFKKVYGMTPSDYRQRRSPEKMNSEHPKK